MVKFEETIEHLNQTLSHKLAEIGRLNDLRLFYESKMEQLNKFVKKVLTLHDKLLGEISALSAASSAHRPFAVVSVNKKPPIPKTPTVTASSKPRYLSGADRGALERDPVEYYFRLQESLKEEFDRIQPSDGGRASKKGGIAIKKIKKASLETRRKSAGEEQDEKNSPRRLSAVVRVPVSRAPQLPSEGLSASFVNNTNVSFESHGSNPKMDLNVVIDGLQEECRSMQAHYKYLMDAVKHQSSAGGSSALTVELVQLLQRIQRKEEQIKRLQRVNDE